eukprot:12632599-Alexandrium_andersonii.AAC.1
MCIRDRRTCTQRSSRTQAAHCEPSYAFGFEARMSLLLALPRWRMHGRTGGRAPPRLTGAVSYTHLRAHETSAHL